MHRQVLYLVKHLNKEIFEPIMCTTGSGGGLREEFEKTGCKLVDLGWKKRVEPAIIVRFIKILNEEKPDIIFINAPQQLLYYLTARIFWRRKVVQIGSFRAMNFWLRHINNRYKPIDRFLSRLMANSSKYIVANSVAIKDQYSKIVKMNPLTPIEVIYNGSDFNFPILRTPVEIRDELKITSDQIMIVMIARLDPWKDFNTLFAAAGIVKEVNSRVKFVIVGDGELRSTLDLMIVNMGLTQTVQMIGEKKDAFDYINAADISVLSTHGEGFSNSILESMALGKPVIASDVGGNSELIGVTNEYGFLFPAKQNKILADIILTLEKDEKLRIKIGQLAKERIQQLCRIEKYISSYELLFLRSVNKIESV